MSFEDYPDGGGFKFKDKEKRRRQLIRKYRTELQDELIFHLLQAGREV